MILLALTLATMPVPITPLPQGDLGGYGALVGETRPAAVRVELTVDASGAPTRCTVVASDGMRALERTACDALMRRARFSPARDAAGATVPAVVRLDFTANRGLAAAAETGGRVDFALPVARLPASTPLMVADVVVLTDATGRATTCDVAATSGSAALDRLACTQVAGQGFAPALDRGGQAVVALRRVSVGFTAGEVAR